MVKVLGRIKGLLLFLDKESAQSCTRALRNKFGGVIKASFGIEDGRTAE